MNSAGDPFAPFPSRPASAPPEPHPGFIVCLPAPEDLPASIRHRRLGKPSQVWRYHDATGALLFAVCRFDGPDGKKEILPYSFGELLGRNGWQWRAPPAPRPLYGLDRLAARPDAPVVVTEGEKAANAAAGLFIDHVVITSPSGARAAHLADWTPLRGRNVVIWPDADAAGTAYAVEVAELARAAGVATVGIVVVPEGVPEGWDVADPLPPGVDAAALRKLLAVAKVNLLPATMPSGFYMTAAGVFAKADDPEKPDVHVCGRLDVQARTHDGNGWEWGLLLHWQDDDGRSHEWAMPRGLLAGDATEVRAMLLRRGLFVGTSRKSREALVTFLMCVKAEAWVRIVPRIGWHDTDTGRVFVAPTETFAPAGTCSVRLQTERSEALPPLCSKGTAEEWRDLAALATGNSRLVLSLSMAFAASLLGLVMAEGGGVHLRGSSSTGKSTALVLAGSVWGGGGLRGWLQRWRTTDNGLEAVAAAHCDLLLTLDELGEVDPRHLGPAAYMLCNGGGKQRAARDGGGRRAAEWRLLFLSSGEVSVADRLSEAGPGRRATAGQDVRVVDLPADAGSGHGVFEAMHGSTSGAAFAERIKTGAGACYGTAGPAFLRHLVADPDGVGRAMRQLRHEFVARNLLADADGQVARVADRFGLFAAGGELAVQFGILPWPAGEATKAAARCLADWRRGRGGDGPAELMAGIAQVRRFLEVNAEGRFRLIGGGEAAPETTGGERIILAGFRRLTANGTEFSILPEVWRAEVTAGFDPGALAKEMVTRGFIDPDPGDGKPARRCSLPGRPKGARAYRVLPAVFVDAADA